MTALLLQSRQKIRQVRINDSCHVLGMADHSLLTEIPNLCFFSVAFCFLLLSGLMFLFLWLKYLGWLSEDTISMYLLSSFTNSILSFWINSMYLLLLAFNSIKWMNDFFTLNTGILTLPAQNNKGASISALRIYNSIIALILLLDCLYLVYVFYCFKFFLL